MEDEGAAEPRFINLTAVADEFRRDGREASIIEAVEDSVKSHSCFVDLKEAWKCVNKLLQIAERHATTTQPGSDGVVEAALLAAGVMLYVRAVSAPGRKAERGSLDLIDRFSPEQLADHNALVALRNKSLAHMEIAIAVEGVYWNQEISVLAETAEGWLAGAVVKRGYVEHRLIALLQHQLEATMRIVEPERKTSHDNVVDSMNNSDDLEYVHAVLGKHLFKCG